MAISPKDHYCYARAAELNESLGMTWKQSYEKAKEEWCACKSTAFMNYDVDTEESIDQN